MEFGVRLGVVIDTDGVAVGMVTFVVEDMENMVSLFICKTAETVIRMVSRVI